MTMTAPKRELIDFTLMYVTHAAFRRDLDRLEGVAASGKAGGPQVRAGWENFKAQIHVHHGVEDATLWPILRTAVADRPGDLVLVDALEAEHARLDPLLDAVDDALRARSADLVDRIQELSSGLVHHLGHEEKQALPLIQDVLTRRDWTNFAAEMRRRQGLKGAAVYVPWTLDGMSPDGRRRVLAALPIPVRWINKLLWEPRYRRRNFWDAGPMGAPSVTTEGAARSA